jgi:hypothetical protein
VTVAGQDPAKDADGIAEIPIMETLHSTVQARPAQVQVGSLDVYPRQQLLSSTHV